MIYTIYDRTKKLRVCIMSIARIFSNEGRQAVRIPKEYRFDVDEVYINKIGNVLVLVPKAELAAEFKIGAAMLSEDFLAEGLPDSVPSVRKAL